MIGYKKKKQVSTSKTQQKHKSIDTLELQEPIITDPILPSSNSKHINKLSRSKHLLTKARRRRVHTPKAKTRKEKPRPRV
jgi:hypothetical protein